MRLSKGLLLPFSRRTLVTPTVMTSKVAELRPCMKMKNCKTWPRANGMIKISPDRTHWNQISNFKKQPPEFPENALLVHTCMVELPRNRQREGQKRSPAPRSRRKKCKKYTKEVEETSSRWQWTRIKTERTYQTSGTVLQHARCTRGVCIDYKSQVSYDIQDQSGVPSLHRAGPHQRQLEKVGVEGILKMGVSRARRFVWVSRAALFMEKDESLRFCVDYQKLNTLIRKPPIWLHPWTENWNL